MGEVREQREVEHDRRGENRIAAEEVDLDLHRVAHPPDDVDVVPALFVVAARRVVVDPHDVREILVQVGVLLGLQDRVEHAQLRLFLRLERGRIVEHFAVAVAEDVRRIPAGEAEHARLESWRDHGLHPRLAGLEIFSRDRHAFVDRELLQRLRVDGEIRRAVAVRNAFHDRRPRVQHRRRDHLVVVVHRLLERRDRRVLRTGLDEDLGRRAPDDHEPVAPILRLEVAHVLPQLLGEIALGLSLLDVRAVDACHVVVVEHGGHRLDRAQKIGHRLEIAILEHTGLLRGGVGVVGNRIPRAEHDLVQRGERNEILDQRRTILGALAESNRSPSG